MVEPAWVDVVWVGGSAIGLAINGWVLYEASKDLEHLRASKVNGQNERDAKAAQTKARLLFLVQAAICFGGAVRVEMESVVTSTLWNKVAMSTAVVLVVSGLVSLIGVMDLRLRRQQLAEILERKRGGMRTRLSD